jgi:hypothetical protein
LVELPNDLVRDLIALALDLLNRLGYGWEGIMMSHHLDELLGTRAAVLSRA